MQQAGTNESNAEQIRSCLARQLPELVPSLVTHDATFVIVGSGTSLPLLVDAIRQERALGRPICAINGAHDFLVDQGITPDLFLTVDPRPMPQNFKRVNDQTVYLMASRCNPSSFDLLANRKVVIWHSWSYEEECKEFRGRFAIGGGTTSGLRAINVAYVLGFRRVHLYGLDSCLDQDKITKRFTGEKAGHVIDVTVGDRTFYCNAAMAQQANEFQELFKVMPDITVKSFGDGLLTHILSERAKLKTTSFIHSGGPEMASFRYRAAIPAKELGVGMNDPRADILIFSKPVANDLHVARAAKDAGKKIVVDFCDDHFDWDLYQQMPLLADVIVCPTPAMQKIISDQFGRRAVVIDDPYEYEQLEPHCAGTKLLWFGHASNLHSLRRIKDLLTPYELRVVSNSEGCMPWSINAMREHFAWADIFVLPKTADYKSCNRAVEAIRQGCFVIAESHPSLVGIPGIYIGNIIEGIEWAKANPQLANQRTREAQKYVAKRFSPKTVADAWRQIIRDLSLISEPEKSAGPVG